MTSEYNDKVVVVSGGSRGIGRGIAAAFAAEGARTVLARRRRPKPRGGRRGDRTHGDRSRPEIVAADLRTRGGCNAVFRDVSDRHGRCDILVNSAGATRAGAFLALGDDVWQDGFALKFFGCVRLSRLFWPLLKAAKGHVVNIIGGAARTPDPEFLIGGSVNAAMHNFTKGLSGLGKRDGVNVNAIHPGMTETERVRATVQAACRGGQDDRGRGARRADRKRRPRAARQARGRRGARAVPDVRERARHIQGTAIAVDGGATAGHY